MTEFFRPLAEMSRKAKGVPGLPLVVVPHPFDTLQEAEVLQVTDAVFDQVVGAITSR